MAICEDCDQEMTEVTTCTAEAVRLGDAIYPRRRAGGRRPCHDCGVRKGGWHHLGCCDERCPLCGWQLITCGCGTTDEEDEYGEPRRVVAPVLASA